VRRREFKFEPARDALLSVLAATLLLWAAVISNRAAPSVAPPKIHGKYELTFAGPGPGSGTAVVTPNAVKIDGTMTDAQGNEITFSATKLPIDRSTYHFKGTGMLGNSPATITGRLDPDDATVKKCRIAATFVAADGRAGRIVGASK
jgi:hypothetical protein